MSDVLSRLTDALSSRYTLSREIGAGGMATVYLARDLRHDRDVAIKVLHPDLAAALGAERFLAEIKTTAKLQHPHILPLLDSGDADGLLFYVMPYVAGESLRARLERETQLAVDDAVRIAREVASALESAHRQGVVHRDIKPENILLHEEQALVADFGIALAVSAAGGPRMTQTGLSLGTPAYMAPEQAMGERAIDGRADIYALGAVLYEMLVGEAPFTGPTVQAIVARVMTEHPRPLSGQRRSVPSHVNAAVLKALEKLPADRFASAAEFATALATPGFTTARDASDATPTSVAAALRVFRKPAVAWSVAGLAIVAAAFSAWRSSSATTDSRPISLAVEVPVGMRLERNGDVFVQLSDDGSMLALAVAIRGRSFLALRDLSSDSLQIVPGSGGALGNPAFSPDGRWIAFNAGDRILKAPVAGGAAIPITSAGWGQIAWTGNDLIYTYTYNTGLFRISSDGGDSTVLTTPDRKRGELGHWWPQILPDGEHVLFTNYLTPADKSRIEVLSLTTGKRTVILESGYFGRYAPGRLLFVRGEVVMSIDFDESSLRTTGSPSSTNLDVFIVPSNGWAAFSVSRNNTLAYRRGGADLIQLSWIDRQGNEENALDSAARITAATPSPDRRSIALVRDGDLWIFDRNRRIYTRLTRTPQREGNPLWTPDSREVYFVRDVPQYDIFRRRADASAPEERVVTSAFDKEPSSFSPDGSSLLYSETTGDADDIKAIRIDATDGKPETIAGGPSSQDGGVFSPDGRWIAFRSSESGRAEVYVMAAPGSSAPWRSQVSVNGGQDPAWTADGRMIYFNSSDQIVRVPVDPAKREIGKTDTLPPIERLAGWALARDGRLLVGRVPESGVERTVRVILNWDAAQRDKSAASR